MAKQENPDWVRVKDTRTGHEITVSRRVVNDKHPYYEAIDKPAVDRSGRPLAAKPLKNLEPVDSDKGRSNEQTLSEMVENDSALDPKLDESGSTTPPPAPAAKTSKGGSR